MGVDDQTGANVYPDNDPAATVDGFVDLENISIDKNGKITGTNKDTGDPVVVGYIALGLSLIHIFTVTDTMLEELVNMKR